MNVFSNLKIGKNCYRIELIELKTFVRSNGKISDFIIDLTNKL